ncbi:hypothetical protein [Hahella ganghwensis]|uniref:hypothetical protein n=1 Tax=Hahella ganghwensis TaxID=286420 RepID=UPI000378E3C8|nr:hypothetical protein [Hahella ganghwensis]
MSQSFGIGYKILHRGSGSWANHDEQEGNVLGCIALTDALTFLTGYEVVPKEGAEPKGVISWSYGEPEDKAPCIAAVPFEYDVMEWDEEFGWYVPSERWDGYIKLSDFLTMVEKHFAFPN